MDSAHQPTPRLGASTSAPWSRFVSTQDAHEQAQVQEGWSLQYEQMSNGRFEGQVHLLQLPGVSLIKETANQAVRQRGDLSSDSFLFALPCAPASEQAIFSGRAVGHDDVMVGPSDGLDLCSPRNFGLMGIVVDATLLQSLWQRTLRPHMADWIRQQRVVSVGQSRNQNLMAMHHAAFELFKNNDPSSLHTKAIEELRDDVVLAWIDALPFVCANDDERKIETRKQVVDKACELMLQPHAEASLSMLALCKQLGVSRRKLNYCFQEQLGMSPIKYQRTARLNQIRQELKQAPPGQGVQDIATRWGFWHMGQFSQDYKCLFGELPSSTLRWAA